MGLIKTLFAFTCGIANHSNNKLMEIRMWEKVTIQHYHGLFQVFDNWSQKAGTKHWFWHPFSRGVGHRSQIFTWPVMCSAEATCRFKQKSPFLCGGSAHYRCYNSTWSKGLISSGAQLLYSLLQPHRHNYAHHRVLNGAICDILKCFWPSGDKSKSFF